MEAQHTARKPGREHDRLFLQRRDVSIKQTEKPWGREVLWAHTDKYAGKILHINEGESLSLQYHEEKDETIYVLDGKMVFTYRQSHSVEGIEELRITLRAGEKVSIPPRVIHRMEAVYGPVVLLEVSTPELDDVTRLSDRYGRCYEEAAGKSDNKSEEVGE